MKSTPGSLIRLIAGITTVLLLSLGAGASAKTFVSFNGKFYITYPDHWDQIDYRSVDYYLTQGNPNPELLAYETVLAPAGELKFFEGPYLLLTLDTIGELIGPAKDSALASIARGFGAKVDSSFSGDMFAQLRPDAPLYDPSTRLLAVETDIHEGRTLVKRNLLVVRLYERGLANFYFYAPDSLWQSSLPVFAQVARSFSPGAPPTGAGKESVKVADIDTEDKASTSSRSIWFIPPGLVVIIIALMMVRRRRKKAADQSQQGTLQ